MALRILDHTPVSSGATADIFKGVYQLNQKKYLVAVKQFKLSDEKHQKYFENEVTALTELLTLKSSFIIKLLATSPEKSAANLFIVLNFLNAGTLFDFLDPDCLPSWEMRTPIVTGITEAVALIHGLDWLHCDLKPENVLLHKRSDGKLLPKICDFGFAKRASDPTFSCNGSPVFIAPELILYFQANSKESDIYSLAMIYYFVATGDYPFSSCESIEELREMKKTPLPLLQNCPKPIGELGFFGASLDPKQRPTAQDMLEQLKKPRDSIKRDRDETEENGGSSEEQQQKKPKLF